jgi:hypothetical protein
MTQFQAYRAARHARFYEGADKAFLGDQYRLDFSGVGHAVQGEGWATLITPQHFLSAAHAAPAPGSRLTFYEGNTTARGRHEYSVAEGTVIRDGGNASDLYLGRLTAPIPAADHITHYPLFVLEADGGYYGEEILVYGGRDWLGRSNITSVAEHRLRHTHTMYFAFHTEGGCGADDVYLRANDSGAPSFVIWQGAFALVGIHSANSTGGGAGVSGSLSADILVPYYVAELNRHLPDCPVAVVPQSTSSGPHIGLADWIARRYLYLAGGLLGLFAAVVLLWIRRRRQRALGPFDVGPAEE